MSWVFFFGNLLSFKTRFRTNHIPKRHLGICFKMKFVFKNFVYPEKSHLHFFLHDFHVYLSGSRSQNLGEIFVDLKFFLSAHKIVTSSLIKGLVNILNTLFHKPITATLFSNLFENQIGFETVSLSRQKFAPFILCYIFHEYGTIKFQNFGEIWRHLKVCVGFQNLPEIFSEITE